MFYPPVISYILKITILKSKTHELSTWPFCIAMFNYKRVCQSQKGNGSLRKASGIRNFQEADQKKGSNRNVNTTKFGRFIYTI